MGRRLVYAGIEIDDDGGDGDIYIHPLPAPTICTLYLHPLSRLHPRSLVYV